MVTQKSHFRYSGTPEIHPTGNGNRITEEYFNFLVGEINRGTIQNIVVEAITIEPFGVTSYYLASKPA